DVTVWLNGTMIYTASGFLTQYQRVPLDDRAVKALKVGDNVLVVFCNQTVGGQYVDLGLVADNKVSLLPLITEHGKDVLGEGGVRRSPGRGPAGAAPRVRTGAPRGGVEVMCVGERGPVTTRVLTGGTPHPPAEEVTAGVPEVLTTDATKVTVAK